MTEARAKPLRHAHSCCKHHDEEVASAKKRKKKQRIPYWSAKIDILFITKIAAKWLKPIPYLLPKRLLAEDSEASHEDQESDTDIDEICVI